jgi:hypothetical protein
MRGQFTAAQEWEGTQKLERIFLFKDLNRDAAGCPVVRVQAKPLLLTAAYVLAL